MLFVNLVCFFSPTSCIIQNPVLHKFKILDGRNKNMKKSKKKMTAIKRSKRQICISTKENICSTILFRKQSSFSPPMSLQVWLQGRISRLFALPPTGVNRQAEIMCLLSYKLAAKECDQFIALRVCTQT